MLTSMPYPWQEKQWEQLRSAAEQDRLAHALLLNGVEGSGIVQFALEFSCYLLCEAPASATACRKCRSCLLFDAGNHPDMRLVSPGDDSDLIRVESIRDLIAYLQLSNQYGRRKIAIIAPAEAMNRHSANSLLKTLEEPAPSVLLILVSYQPSRLPVTIRSRCRNIGFNKAGRQLSSDWLGRRINDPVRAAELLELAGGAPLKALDLDGTDALQRLGEILEDLQGAGEPGADPVKIAEKWHNHGATEVSARLLDLFGRMALLHTTGNAPETGRSFIDVKLLPLMNGINLSRIIECYDLALKNHRLLTGEINLNQQGLLEEIIVHWQSIHG